MDNTKYNHDILKTFATSDLYQLLSVSLRFPSQELAEAISDGRYGHDSVKILEELTVDAEERNRIKATFKEMEDGASDVSRFFEELRREYTRLFDDPKKPAIDIYETIFVGDEQTNERQRVLFCSSAACDAEQCYRDAGLGLINQYQEPADHIATELEFMMYLYGKKGKALQEQDSEQVAIIVEQIENFEKSHIRKWVVRFFEQLETQANVFAYQGLARLAQVGLRQVID